MYIATYCRGLLVFNLELFIKNETWKFHGETNISNYQQQKMAAVIIFDVIIFFSCTWKNVIQAFDIRGTIQLQEVIV